MIETSDFTPLNKNDIKDKRSYLVGSPCTYSFLDTSPFPIINIWNDPSKNIGKSIVIKDNKTDIGPLSVSFVRPR